MARISEGDFSNSLGATDLPKDVDKALFTIADAEVKQSDEGNKLIVKFKEAPHKSYWVNKTGTKTLIKMLGEETDEWAGRKVPLEKVKSRNPKSGESVVSLWVCDAADWPKSARK